ncbi:MAG: response regulator [Undibacterium sp.]|nr:response regulator [Opitutaceae bacterium]
MGTILVAEDEPQVRLLAVRILDRAGCKVYAAADGGEAFAVFVEHGAEIALRVLDVVTPRMGGLEVRERAHRLRADAPVTHSSGDAGRAPTQATAPIPRGDCSITSTGRMSFSAGCDRRSTGYWPRSV